MKNDDRSTHRKKARNHPAFRYLDPRAFETLYNSAEVESFTEGERIIAEGDASPDLFFVVEGTVNIVVAEEGTDVFIAALGEGQVFGEAAIFTSVRRTASVVSGSDSALVRIRRRQFLDFVKANPSDGIKMLLVIIFSLLRKLRDANQELAYERKFDVGQDDIDAMVNEIISE